MMDPISIISAGVRLVGMSIALYERYKNKQHANKHVQSYFTKLQLYETSLKLLEPYINEQKNHNPFIEQDPEWQKYLQTFEKYVEEDKNDNIQLAKSLHEAMDRSWWKNTTWSDKELKIQEKINVITFFINFFQFQDKRQAFETTTRDLTNPQAKAFWVAEVGVCVQASVEHVAARLQDYLHKFEWLPNVEYLKSIIVILKITADVLPQNNIIVTKEWNAFVCRFGPLDQNLLKRATAVCAIDSLGIPLDCRYEWFDFEHERKFIEEDIRKRAHQHDLAHPEELQALNNAISNHHRIPRGTYTFSAWVLRFTKEKNDHFAWSFFVNKKFKHLLIRNTPQGYYMSEQKKDEPTSPTASPTSPPPSPRQIQYFPTVIDLIYHENIRTKLDLKGVDKSHVERWEKYFWPPFAPGYSSASELEALALDYDDGVGEADVVVDVQVKETITTATTITTPTTTATTAAATITATATVVPTPTPTPAPAPTAATTAETVTITTAVHATTSTPTTTPPTSVIHNFNESAEGQPVQISPTPVVAAPFANTPSSSTATTTTTTTTTPAPTPTPTATPTTTTTTTPTPQPQKVPVEREGEREVVPSTAVVATPAPTTPTIPNQTIIETKSPVANEQKILIVIDHVDAVDTPASTHSRQRSIASPASTTTSSPSSTTHGDSDLDTAKRAAASADAIDNAKDVTKSSVDSGSTSHGAAQPKPVIACCSIQ